MEVVRLTSSDCTLLSARYSTHANSHRRMSIALTEAGAGGALGRLTTLRALERQFDVDLGMLCHWYEQRDAAQTHPVQSAIIRYLTASHVQDGGPELWIRLDRVRDLRDLMEESRLVGDPES